jgi:hypothetical protein
VGEGIRGHSNLPRGAVAAALVLPLTLALTGGAGGASPTPAARHAAATTPPSPGAGPGSESGRPSRVAIRRVDGEAEFYLVDSGTRFVPRGVNYVDFYRDEQSAYRDAVFATDTWDPARVREAFRTLAALGYDTVRIFFENCFRGPHCFAEPSERGLRGLYLDNMVEAMRIAADEGIWIIFTANAIPEGGRYWEHEFEPRFAGPHPGFERRENADWLHEAGVETKAAIWEDLMSGLAARDAPFEVVLGWQLTNEFWLHKQFPPMSLSKGRVTTANGRTYDLAKPKQKRRMVIDGVAHFVDRIRPIIRRYDPDGLVTMGFYAPQFPVPTGLGGDTYVDTAPLLRTLDLDFFDFHAYSDTELTVEQQARNLGMLGYRDKPIIMGETGSGKAIVPSAVRALGQAHRWIAASCQVGFDGWLNWGYYPWPDDFPGKPWALLDADGLLLRGLSPAYQPDPCKVPTDSPGDVLREATVRASSSLPGAGPRRALDGTNQSWNSGRYPPGSIEFRFRRPVAIDEVALAVDQWPPGEAHHRVWATTADGRQVLLADLRRYAHPETLLLVTLPAPMPRVARLRVETLRGPGWVAWREVSATSSPVGEEVCLVRAPQLREEPSQRARRLPPLPRGALVQAEARLASDARWLRVPGDAWMLASPDTCPSLPLVGGPAVELVRVRFDVRLPAGSGEAFIAGDFGADSLLPVWAPATVILLPAGKVRRRTEVLLPAGAEVAYKYTEGGWDRVERSASCADVPDRTVTISPGLVVRDRIPTWADRC